MPIELVMPSNHLILCHPLLLLPSIFPSIRVFSNESVLPYSPYKAMVFPVVVRKWELDHKEGWTPKNWCFQIVVLEKTLESALECKEIRSVNPKGNQPWIFIRRTDGEALIIWPPDAKGWLIRKDTDVGKDWRQKEKGVTEDEMVGWHHWLNGHELE